MLLEKPFGARCPRRTAILLHELLDGLHYLFLLAPVRVFAKTTT